MPGPGGERCAYTAPSTAGAASLTGLRLLSSSLPICQWVLRLAGLSQFVSTGLSQSSGRRGLGLWNEQAQETGNSNVRTFRSAGRTNCVTSKGVPFWSIEVCRTSITGIPRPK